MSFTPGQRKLLAFWGSIQSSVTQRASTSELWNAVRAKAAAEGVELSGVRATDMNALRSIAADQRVKGDRLTAAPKSRAIDASMIGRDLSSRSVGDQLVAPRWIARFEHTIEVGGETQTLWRASVFESALPTTVGELGDQLEQDAQAMADDYDQTHVGVGRISLVAV